MKTVAELIDNLFRTHKKPNGREYTHKEVCDTLGTLSESHLSKLRNGVITNPGRDMIASLCQFFRVPSSYFFPELEAMAITEPPKDHLDVLVRAAKSHPAVQQKMEELLDAVLGAALGSAKGVE